MVWEVAVELMAVSLQTCPAPVVWTQALSPSSQIRSQTVGCNAWNGTERKEPYKMLIKATQGPEMIDYFHCILTFIASLFSDPRVIIDIFRECFPTQTNLWGIMQSVWLFMCWFFRVIPMSTDYKLYCHTGDLISPCSPVTDRLWMMSEGLSVHKDASSCAGICQSDQLK